MSKPIPRSLRGNAALKPKTTSLVDDGPSPERRAYIEAQRARAAKRGEKKRGRMVLHRW